MTYHLGIDIGASGGRHILGWTEGGKIYTKEVYRFENGIINENGFLVWDIYNLEKQVLVGLIACKAQGYIPATVAIDTWGVDYVLLDKAGRAIMPVYAYRDGSTALIQQEIGAVVPREELYNRTGIQHQNFNSIYRLWCDKKQGRLDRAENMLMMPEYLSYRLTGKMCKEYTNATTTALVNAHTRDWDFDLIEKLGYPKRLFGDLQQPATMVGPFTVEVEKALGYNATVVLCPSHDTAAAVAACPMEGEGAYISSGTWSLVGAETQRPIISAAARKGNYTNEGGVDGTYRFLKNIMGMWLLQGIRKSTDKKYSYDEMMALAENSTYTKELDPNSKALTAPEDMLAALRGLLGDENLPLGDVLSSVYHSLAKNYATAIKDVENLSGKKLGCVYIMGGGSKDTYLNKLTAKYTGKPVFAGPTEATALGNIIYQMMYVDNSFTLQNARALVKSSFLIKEFNCGG